MNFKPTILKVLVCLGFILFFIMASLQLTTNTSSQKTLVDSSQERYIFPKSITNLRVVSYTNDSITWSWDNPQDENFMLNKIYLNENYVGETNGTTYTAKNLESGKTYTIRVESYDKNLEQMNTLKARISMIMSFFPFLIISSLILYTIWSLFQKGKKMEELVENTKIDLPKKEKIKKKKR